MSPFWKIFLHWELRRHFVSFSVHTSCSLKKKWAYHYLYGFSILESLLRLYLPLKLETRSKMQSFIFFFFVEKSINFLELFALWLLNIYWVRLLICAWEALSTKGSRVELILASNPHNPILDLANRGTGSNNHYQNGFGKSRSSNAWSVPFRSQMHYWKNYRELEKSGI